MLKTTRLIALVIILGMACLCFGVQKDTPVPPNFRIHTPDPSLPEQLKSVLGKWTGRWNTRFGWEVTLYIEKINKDSAQVIYAWGDFTTPKGSCHCKPNWVRVREAKVSYFEDHVTLDFYTPTLRPAWLRESHSVSGGADEVFRPHGKSVGRYAYSFKVYKDKPDTMTGQFYSAKGSPMSIVMKKSE
jgi:hypothetical protein